MKALHDHRRSPCIGVCQLESDDGLCVGCLRTSTEIVLWSRLSEEERRAVWRRVRERASARRRSGRSA